MEDERAMEGFEAFRKETLKVNGKKKGKISGSWGVYDAYKLIRKHGWYDIGRPLKEHEFYSIIRSVNNLLAENIAKGNSIRFPSRMGSLELRKSHRGARIVDGKLKITYPVDWNGTLKLWFTDPEARKDKTLIRLESDTVYHIKYCKYNATYANKGFYEFALNKDIKTSLRDNIRNGLVDALYEDY